MGSPVEQIKERLGIAEVVGSYLELTRAGSSLKAKCPFHNEKTPSFFVSPARNTYYCFGCQAHGDIFSFVQEFEGLDFVGALRVLAQRAGVVLGRVDPKLRSEYARLYLCLEKATRFFEERLHATSSVQEYLTSRGLKPETIQAWRLGYAPNEWRSLYDELRRETCTNDEMVKVGLIKPSEREKGSYYDVFRGRVMFPIMDSAGRVIAFSGRILPALDDGKTGKYVNSPETILFSKSQTLYGFDKAKLVIREKDAAILVEGQMDLLMAHQAGYRNTVATSGTALTMDQLTRLKRLSENLLLAFDADTGGAQASERAIRLALSLGMNVKVVAITGGKDPAELIQKEPEAWEAAVNTAKHVVDFLLDGLMRAGSDARAQALSIERKLLPLIRLLPSSVEQSHFIKVIAEKSGLREEALWGTFKKLPSTRRGEEEAKTQSTVPVTAKPNMLERRVFGMYFLAESRNTTSLLERVRSALRNIFGEGVFNKKGKEHEELREALLLEAEVLYGDAGPSAKEEQELLRHLEEEHVTKLLSVAMDKLAKAEHEGKKEEEREFLERCKELTQRLGSLKSKRFTETNEGLR